MSTSIGRFPSLLALVIKYLTYTANFKVPLEAGNHTHHTSADHRTGLTIEVQGEQSSLLT